MPRALPPASHRKPRQNGCMRRRPCQPLGKAREAASSVCNQAVRFFRHSNFPVIPAKAGIYALRWTPVFAETTDPHLNHPKVNTTVADAGRQRFQSGALIFPHHSNFPVIPIFPRHSGLRRNLCPPAPSPTPPTVTPTPPTVIPAQAGI